MKKHYDFSKSVRNPYLSKAKKQLTIRLDEDTIEYFKALAEKGINIQVISTSEIKVSVLVAEDYTELALRALHTVYGLDAP